MPDGNDVYTKFAEAYGMSEKAAKETLGRYQTDPASSEWANLTAMEKAGIQSAAEEASVAPFPGEVPPSTAPPPKSEVTIGATPPAWQQWLEEYLRKTVEPWQRVGHGAQQIGEALQGAKQAWQSWQPYTSPYGMPPEQPPATFPNIVQWPEEAPEPMALETEQFKANQKVLQDFQQQMQDWELARRGYQYDWVTGQTVQGAPVNLPLPKMPPESEGMVDPAFLAWYKQLSQPVGTGEKQSDYETKYTDQPERIVPDYFNTLSPNEQAVWASANAYDSVYTDQQGNILSFNDVRRLVEIDPDTKIKQVWLLGGENHVIEADYYPDEITRPAGASPGVTPTSVVETATAATAEALRTKEDAILQDATIENYGQKVAQVQNLYLSEGSGYQGDNAYRDAVNKVQGAMSVADRERLSAEAESSRGFEASQKAWRDFTARTGREISWEDWINPPAQEVTKTDTKALGAALSQYGISVLSDYPYLSPVSQAQIARIPTDILNQMARYLQEMGISWNDFVAVGQSYYGGGAGATGRYAIPQQWG